MRDVPHTAIAVMLLGGCMLFAHHGHNNDSLVGDIPLVFVNATASPVCEVLVSGGTPGVSKEIEEVLPRGDSFSGTTPLPPGGEVTFRARAAKVSISIVTCDHGLFSHVDRVEITGPTRLPMAEGRATPPAGAPPGYRLLAIEMKTPSGRSGPCEPPGTTENDTTKCCSGHVKANADYTVYRCL